jgi:hypothetical protein
MVHNMGNDNCKLGTCTGQDAATVRTMRHQWASMGCVPLYATVTEMVLETGWYLQWYWYWAIITVSPTVKGRYNILGECSCTALYS